MTQKQKFKKVVEYRLNEFSILFFFLSFFSHLFVIGMIWNEQPKKDIIMMTNFTLGFLIVGFILLRVFAKVYWVKE